MDSNFLWICKNICVSVLCVCTGIIFTHLFLGSMISQLELLTRPFSCKKKLQGHIYWYEYGWQPVGKIVLWILSLETMCPWKQLQSKFYQWYYGYFGWKQWTCQGAVEANNKSEVFPLNSGNKAGWIALPVYIPLISVGFIHRNVQGFCPK